MERSLRAEVRNPLLKLRSVHTLMALDPAPRAALREVLLDLREEASGQAQKCWEKSKPPMAAYWRAVAIWSFHVARMLKKGGPGLVTEAFAIADDSMREQLVCHCLPGTLDSSRLQPCGVDGKAVAHIKEADAPIREAYDWLKRRGLAHVERKGESELIVLRGNASNES